MRLQLPQFSSNKELFAHLVANKSAFVDLAKSTVKYADAFGVTESEANVVKAANVSTNDTADVIKRTVIGNTYNWLDSHGDVHANGCFAKSITERTPWHLHDHVQQIMAKVGTPTAVYENNIPWQRLGVQKAGTTQALFMDSDISKELNAGIFRAYKSGEITQHSVGMRYVKLALAVNDDEYPAEKKVWDDNIGIIGNPAEAEKTGFFWLVQEAKLVEISCVLEGSNSLTPTLDTGTVKQPEQSTDEQPQFDISKAISNIKIIQ